MIRGNVNYNNKWVENNTTITGNVGDNRVYCDACVATLSSSTPKLVIPMDLIFSPMDRVIASESIQYDWEGSKDLYFADLNRNSICH